MDSYFPSALFMLFVFFQYMQGDHWAWKVMGFRKTKFQAWIVMENNIGHRKSWYGTVLRPNSTRRTGTEPNQTRPDQTRPDISGLRQSPTCLVLAKFHYTGPTRLCRRLSQKNLPRRTRPQRNCCRYFNYTSMQLQVYY